MNGNRPVTKQLTKKTSRHDTHSEVQQQGQRLMHKGLLIK